VRRIADAHVGATLVAHLEGLLGHAARCGAGQHRPQLAAIGFNLAEELVGLLFARRQFQRIELEAAVHRLHRDAVLVEVIAVRDLPVEFDPAALGGLCAQREGFLHRQQIVGVDRGARGPGTRHQRGGENETEQGHARPGSAS
jgi:hypothetical protein